MTLTTQTHGGISSETSGGIGANWRVPIRSNYGRAPYGRKNFFLHGGSYTGSAGCIDIGGGVFGDTMTDKVLKSIMEVEVNTLWAD